MKKMVANIAGYRFPWTLARSTTSRIHELKGTNCALEVHAREGYAFLKRSHRSATRRKCVFPISQGHYLEIHKSCNFDEQVSFYPFLKGSRIVHSVKGKGFALANRSPLTAFPLRLCSWQGVKGRVLSATQSFRFFKCIIQGAESLMYQGFVPC
jgi:hypothetical protein